jgi:hypothetical protein
MRTITGSTTTVSGSIIYEQAYHIDCDTIHCPETNEVRERELINADVRVREALQKEVA